MSLEEGLYNVDCREFGVSRIVPSGSEPAGKSQPGTRKYVLMRLTIVSVTVIVSGVGKTVAEDSLKSSKNSDSMWRPAGRG